MKVGSLKRLLGLLNLAAVFALGGAAYGYLSHRQAMASPPAPPSFRPPDRPVEIDRGETAATAMKLGRFPKKTEAVPEEVKEEPEVTIQSVLDGLGAIEGAVILYPPYEGDQLPSITFRLKSGGSRTLKLGEAIESRDDPKSAKPVPVRYRFVAVRPHESDPRYAWFYFDMKCDGTDIQRTLWKDMPDQDELPTGTGRPSGRQSVYGPGIKVIYGEGGASDPDLEGLVLPVEGGPVPGAAPGEAAGEGESEGEGETRPAEAEPAVEPERPLEVETVEPPSVQPVASGPADPAPRRPIFESDGGSFAPTDEGVEYLRQNYERLIRDAQVVPYESGGRRGLHVKRIVEGSAARQFGIRESDVILAVNGRTVTSEMQAVNVVKDELTNRKKTIIEVRVLRVGREITLTYDARDPATRRAARDLRRR